MKDRIWNGNFKLQGLNIEFINIYNVFYLHDCEFENNKQTMIVNVSRSFTTNKDGIY